MSLQFLVCILSRIFRSIWSSCRGHYILPWFWGVAKRSFPWGFILFNAWDWWTRCDGGGQSCCFGDAWLTIRQWYVYVSIIIYCYYIAYKRSQNKQLYIHYRGLALLYCLHLWNNTKVYKIHNTDALQHWRKTLIQKAWSPMHAQSLRCVLWNCLYYESALAGWLSR